MALADQPYISESDYLTLDASSDNRHEYANGQVIAMTGASWAHNVICVNTSSSLNVQLMDSDCQVTANDMRLKVLSKRSYRYPDVMVICGKPDFVQDRVDTISNPIVIVEVLSEAAALIDRNEKLAEYTQIPTLQEYLLISQTEARIERYLRQDSGNWLYTQFTGLGSSLELPSIGCTLAMATIYNKVRFDS